MNSSSPTVWLRTTSSASLATPLEDAGDDGAEVGLLDQRVDVDALEDAIQVQPLEQAVQVDPVQHPVDVDLVQHGVQVDLVQQRIHIQRGNHQVDRTLRDGLGQMSARLHARDEPTLDQAPSLKRVQR